MMSGMWLPPSCFLLAYTEVHVLQWPLFYSRLQAYIISSFLTKWLSFFINGTLISTGNHLLFIWITLAFDHAKVTLLRCHGLLTWNNRVRMPLLSTFPMEQQEALP
jgi:hypothetical protein